MADFRKGDRLRVIDVSNPKTAKGKLPFAVGAEFDCEDARRGHVALKGVQGWWKASRFAEVARG